jgi:hypothetical protein
MIKIRRDSERIQDVIGSTRFTRLIPENQLRLFYQNEEIYRRLESPFDETIDNLSCINPLTFALFHQMINFYRNRYNSNIRGVSNNQRRQSKIIINNSKNIV